MTRHQGRAHRLPRRSQRTMGKERCLAQQACVRATERRRPEEKVRSARTTQDHQRREPPPLRPGEGGFERTNLAAASVGNRRSQVIWIARGVALQPVGMVWASRAIPPATSPAASTTNNRRSPYRSLRKPPIGTFGTSSRYGEILWRDHEALPHRP